MRRISIDNIREGMELGKSVYSSDGNILLAAGVSLRENYIRRFKELNITEIYIEDEISKDIVIKDIIPEEIRFEARVEVRKAMDAIKLGEKLTTRSIRNVVNNIVDELLSSDDLMFSLQDIKSIDDYLFGHGVNVCVLSIITGISLEYDREQLKNLAMGAMLHDIGKTKIPYEVLNKPDRLTEDEFEIIKKHPTIGYEILKESDDISLYSRIIALTHHERYDGKGYPLGIASDQIHEFSRIVSIADVYDAMTSDRVYRKRIKINEAVEYLIGLGNHNFDYRVVRNFLEHVTVYPIGTLVKLNSGQSAIVVDINKRYPNRPIIRVLTDEDGNSLQSFKEFDLTKHNSLLIVDTLETL